MAFSNREATDSDRLGAAGTRGGDSMRGRSPLRLGVRWACREAGADAVRNGGGIIRPSSRPTKVRPWAAEREACLRGLRRDRRCAVHWPAWSKKGASMPVTRVAG
jgi:hypothetical protein